MLYIELTINYPHDGTPVSINILQLASLQRNRFPRGSLLSRRFREGFHAKSAVKKPAPKKSAAAKPKAAPNAKISTD